MARKASKAAKAGKGKKKVKDLRAGSKAKGVKGGAVGITFDKFGPGLATSRLGTSTISMVK